MRKFLSEIFIFLTLGSIPIIILLGLYIYHDPFKVLKKYDNYSNLKVIPNRDYISTEVFLKNYDIEKYDSFIFGSSRTLAFRPSEWVKYLPVNSKPFAFDAFSETIYGIHGKLKLLDSLNIKINNCVIFICEDNAFAYDGNSKGHIFIKHPITSKDTYFEFQFEFLKSYYNPKFLLSYYTNLLTNISFDFMGEYLEFRQIQYDTKTNETLMKSSENLLIENSEEYYKKANKYFYERKGEKIDSIQRINKHKLDLLTEIKNILEKNQAQIKVVISPLYNQTKLNPADLKILKKLFKEDLFDFSGKNEMTTTKYNYYEFSHFRPFIGDSIMSKIYK